MSLSKSEIEKKVVDGVNAIAKGPLPLRLYMEICAKCGTCAEVCPVYYGSNEKSLNPAERSDLIRRIYKSQNTVFGKLFGGDGGFTADDIDKWAKEFYECTGCRRCAVYCPFGIDNSVITRKGRAIVDQLGKTPETMAKVVKVSLETGNTDGASAAAFQAAIDFLEEEMEDEHGVPIKIPIDKYYPLFIV